MSTPSSARSRAGRIDEPPFRLRPAKPKPRGGEAAAWSKALTTVLRYARQSRRKPTPAGAANGGGSGSRNQRCAVRITYSANKVRGQWRAHGRYIARETVTGNHREAGFGSAGEKLAPAETLAEWQKFGDPRLWKLILSPEFGARMDLQKMTREVMARMEQDLGTKLEWVAVAHFNTEHPHVHVALRGVRADGSAVDLKVRPRQPHLLQLRFQISIPQVMRAQRRVPFRWEQPLVGLLSGQELPPRPPGKAPNSIRKIHHRET